jgi:lipoprotein-anchoring transpeptidase ErfK/SrfK
MRVRATVVILACVFVATACSSHDNTQQVLPSPHRIDTAPSSSLPPVTPPTTQASPPPAIDAAYSVTARNSTIAVYPAPNTSGKPQVLPNPWIADPSRPDSKVPQVFLIQPGTTARGWLHVLLPVRPNGSTGWVRAQDVSVGQINYRILVVLPAHRITVFNGNKVMYQGPIATGKPSTPTPTGYYYIRVLIKAPNPNTVYGPYAYGLSSHSDVLSNFNGGDGEIGIHGNDDASVLGHDVTHGCIRMDNSEISLLAATLPLGTPVEVIG